MDNRDVLNKIGEQMRVCQEKIKNNSATESDAMAVSTLISQYVPGNNFKIRIKKNRLAELEALRAKIGQSNRSRQKLQNIYYGRWK